MVGIKRIVITSFLLLPSDALVITSKVTYKESRILLVVPGPSKPGGSGAPSPLSICIDTSWRVLVHMCPDKI